MSRIEKEDIRFRIDQLRKDKIIYAVQSLGVSVSALILSIVISVVFSSNRPLILPDIFVLAVVYWLFVAFRSARITKEIQKLERQLQ
jgi:hypothetical protein